MSKLVKVDVDVAFLMLTRTALDLTRLYAFWAKREADNVPWIRDTAARAAGACLGKLYRIQEERDAVLQQLGGYPHPQETKPEFKKFSDLYTFVDRNGLGVLEEDNYGQIIICTDLSEASGGELIPFVQEEE